MTPSDTLASQLTEIFGERLRMIAVFGPSSSTCAIVSSLTMADLDRCAGFTSGWKRQKLDPPLLIPLDELARGVDAFPLEFNEIIATRRVIAGSDLFAAVSVSPEDLRRACEVQARGHQLHLREGYIEAAGNSKAIGRLVSASLVPFRALIANVARLDGISPDALAIRLNLGMFDAGFPEALRATEQIVAYVDHWKH
jgi:hypothetical protein